MALTFVVLGLWIVAFTVIAPSREARTMPAPQDFDLTPSRSATWAGGVIVVATIALYVVFY
jgi:hypothetical protein